MPERKGGKKQQFTVDEVEKVLWNSLGNISVAATILKCERSTIYDYITRYPDRLADIRAKSRGDLADIAEGHLLVAARQGKEWAVREVLRAHGKFLGYGEQVDVHLTGEVAVIPPTNVTVTFVRPPPRA